ncbi:chorismate synthase [Thermincola potens]|uniref:Chorismate synthase n=1 Tax=Thermincola potens (strain JR) TaxID=635013 RepID=D5X7M1_THEPJ|nr:chorismate synthase [Thermincola potens]ADG82591.1 chorismate synthase [Thermincola potens JR]
MLRFLNAGESHGPALTAIVEGMPAGVPVTEEYINTQLARRQMGYGRGGRMKIERDQVEFTAGVRGGFTLGTPICLVIRNRDYANWEKTMTPSPSADLDERVVTRPRPGHADLAGAIKYNHADIRNVLERASARETATRVAVGALGRRLLEMFGIQIFGHVVQIGSVRAVIPPSYEEVRRLAAASELFCADPEAEQAMKTEIDASKEAGDSLGGIFEVVVTNLPVGLGSFVQWDRKLDGRLAQAVMSIQAVKGVEIGMGFRAATLPGSQVHDEIFYGSGGFYRCTNRAGGLEGGITNGEPLVIRAAMKPIPTLYKPLKSVDLATKEPFAASVERSDTCAVPAAAVVAEAAVAFELARAMIEKFGGDSLAEMQRNYEAYVAYVRQV